MVGPLLALAPVIPPVIDPIVQEKLLGAEAVKTIFELAPLHVLVVTGLVTTGIGFTVTVIVKGVPEHDPVVDVGVTMYSTVPAIELSGLVSI